MGLSGAVRARAAPFLELPRREVAALAVLGLLALAGAGFAYVRARPLPALPSAVVSVSPTTSPGAPSGMFVVHVVGAVRRPGVYEVPAGARVRDAVARAGGLARTADAAGINLARPVVDGEQIVVPARGDPPREGGGSAGGTGSGGGGGKININLAGVAEFDTLPGVGPVIAQRIVEYRDANGPFAAVRDLMKVPGIGPKKFASLEPYLTV